MVRTPCPVPYIVISSLSCVFNPEVCSPISIAILKQFVTYYTHIRIPACFITQRPATITTPARVGFSTPTSSITNSQGKGKGSSTTKPTCFSAGVFLATTTSGGTTTRLTVVYICSQHHRQRVSQTKCRAARRTATRGPVASTGGAPPCVLRTLPQVGSASTGQYVLCVPMAAAPQQMCHSTVSPYSLY
jgi:hypothetical protein